MGSEAQDFPKFSPAEYERRFRLVRDLMRREGVEALVIHGAAGSPGGLHYLSNYLAPRPAWLIFPLKGDSTLFLHFYNHIPCTKAMSIVEDVRCYQPSPGKAVAEELRRRGLGGATIGIVGLSDSIPHGQFEVLRQGLPGATFRDLARPYHEIRLIRSEEEIGWFRRSAYLTDLTCEALERRARPGLSEFDLSAIIHDAFLPDGGLMGIHFLAATEMENPERPLPWQYLTPRALRKGDVLLTEITITHWGYGTQIHRPFAIGVEPTPLYRRLFDVAYECYERVRRVTRPGATSEEIIAASSVIEESGFTVYDSLFHGEGGRGPELGTKSAAHPFEPFTLRENMVVVIQPNPITPDGRAGLQLGAALVVGKEGGECLHHYPFKFPVCG